MPSSIDESQNGLQFRWRNISVPSISGHRMVTIRTVANRCRRTRRTWDPWFTTL